MFHVNSPFHSTRKGFLSTLFTTHILGQASCSVHAKHSVYFAERIKDGLPSCLASRASDGFGEMVSASKVVSSHIRSLLPKRKRGGVHMSKRSTQRRRLSPTQALNRVWTHRVGTFAQPRDGMSSPCLWGHGLSFINSVWPDILLPPGVMNKRDKVQP